jgi:hypothetical protein
MSHSGVTCAASSTCSRSWRTLMGQEAARDHPVTPEIQPMFGGDCGGAR